jgi:aminoglycoside 3-N-acetyltransferase
LADMQPVVTRTDLVKGFRELGATAGEILMAHSSLSSFGWVEGGAETVIEALLEAVGPTGTVVLPTLCQRDIERRFETWDIATSVSDVGRITEVFRVRPDTVRSDHPTHSVAAMGPQAEAITSGHATAEGRPSPWGPRAFGHGSPWDKFYQLDILDCFLGVNFSCNTMRHYIQSQLVEQVLNFCANRQVAGAQLAGWGKPGVWPNYQGPLMQQRLSELGLVTETRIGEATCYSIRARAMVDNALRILRAEPEQWFDAEFLAWYLQHSTREE